MLSTQRVVVWRGGGADCARPSYRTRLSLEAGFVESVVQKSRARDNTNRQEDCLSLGRVRPRLVLLEYFRSRESTVNIALSERTFSGRSHLVNGFKRDRSTSSKERRAKEASIERTLAFSQRTFRLRSAFTQCHVDCTQVSTIAYNA